VNEENAAIAARLEEVGGLLEQQSANPFRVEAYRRAARTLRQLARPVSELLQNQGIAGLDALPGIGPILARAIFILSSTGRLPMLERLRGESDPIALLASVSGIGPKLADRLHHDLAISSLEDLETAAWDGRLANVAGFGPKRLAGIRDSLATRLGRARRSDSAELRDRPAVSELLDVDREYRTRAAEGSLPTIAPRRFNPTKRAWLPILHTQRRGRQYTALFSNTARAHSLGKTRDWVVLYADGARGEGQWTVVTESAGELEGKRVVRGRENECTPHYRGAAPPESVSSRSGPGHAR
jgi:putative hydrolase